MDSEDARKSIWVAYELQYAEKNKKKILSIKQNDFVDQIEELHDDWFKGISIDRNKLIGKELS